MNSSAQKTTRTVDRIKDRQTGSDTYKGRPRRWSLEPKLVGEEKKPFPDEKVSKKLSSLDKKMASKPYGYKRSNEKNRSMKIDSIRDAVKRGEDPRKDTRGGAFAKRGNPDHDHRADYSDNRRKRTVKKAGV